MVLSTREVTAIFKRLLKEIKETEEENQRIIKIFINNFKIAKLTSKYIT